MRYTNLKGYGAMTNKINTLKFANSLKSHENYSDNEIMGFLAMANNSYEYDCIIDSLYFKDKKNRSNVKNRTEYSCYTARSLKEREKREDSIEHLTDVKHMQFKKH